MDARPPFRTTVPANLARPLVRAILADIRITPEDFRALLDE